jgi:GNAT superfamily N-acetyltransferase
MGAGDEDAVLAARALFDRPPDRDATRRFLGTANPHLLLAWLDGGDEPVGFVSGVATTHPDKSTEMFLYDLGVEERARRRGVGGALVAALATLARERGCYAMGRPPSRPTPRRRDVRARGRANRADGGDCGLALRLRFAWR